MNHGLTMAARNRILLRRSRSFSVSFVSLAKLAAILVSLVVLGLDMPRVTTLLFPVLVLLYAIPRREFLTENILLFLFLVTHFVFAVFYGEILLFDAIKYIIIGQSAYCLGVYVRWQRLPFWPNNTLIAVLAYGTGLFCFGFLSSQLTMSRYAYLVPLRSFVAFWSGEIGNAIDMVDFMGVIIALMPATVIGLTRLRRDGSTRFTRMLLALVYLGIILMGVEGLLINGYFQNRGPFVMLATISGVVMLYYLRRQSFIASAKTLFLSIGLCGIVFLILSKVIDFGTPFDLITARFSSQELETSRYYMWGQGLQSLVANPLGGVVINRGLLGDNYFHSLWLDVGRCSGILPLFFLVIFQIKHVRSLVTILRQAGNILIEISLLSLGLCMFFVYIYEPVIEGGQSFLFLNFFILGIIRYLGKEIGREQAERQRKGRGGVGHAIHSRMPRILARREPLAQW